MGRATWVRGIKEDICWDEYWVLYIGDESLESTPEIIIALYANLDVNLKKKKSVGAPQWLSRLRVRLWLRS